MKGLMGVAYERTVVTVYLNIDLFLFQDGGRAPEFIPYSVLTAAVES